MQLNFSGIPAKHTSMPQPRSPRQRGIWSLNPGVIFSLALLIPVTIAVLIPDVSYRNMWKTQRYVEFSDLLLALSCVAAFWGGGAVYHALKGFSPARPHVPSAWGKFSEEQLSLISRFFKIGFWSTTLGSGVWLLSTIKNGFSLAFLMSLFTEKRTTANSSDALMLMTGTIPGVTTLTQLAMATFILGAILIFNGKGSNVGRMLVALFFMTLFRCLINSERLSLIEELIPMLILFGYYNLGRIGKYLTGWRSVFMPLVAVGSLYLIFTTAEYFRSWKDYYEATGDYDSIWEFGFLRLVGYYATAVNNGAMIFSVQGTNTVPEGTFDWLWRFPVVGDSVYSLFTGIENAREARLNMTYDILSRYANMELNNLCGFFNYVRDWGPYGALLFFFIVGFFAFVMHRSFRNGTAFGVFLYPFFFVGLLEISRISYWTAGRSFPTWAFLILLLCLIKKHRPGRNEKAKQLIFRRFNKQTVQGG